MVKVVCFIYGIFQARLLEWADIAFSHVTFNTIKKQNKTKQNKPTTLKKKTRVS